MLNWTIALLLILITQYEYARSEDYCYSLDREKPQKRHFSDATSYAYVRGAQYGRQYAAPSCRPSKFWMLARHGTSLPNKRIIESLDELRMFRNEVMANYQRPASSRPSNETLCPDDLKLIRYWNLDKNITVEHSNFLTIQGWNDMKSLAKSFKRIFPDLLGRGYDVKQFRFRFPNEQRTEGSYKAFVEGLFEKDAYLDINISSIAEPSSWLDKYKPTNDFIEEVNNFRKSTIMLRMISDVSARLGYQYPLSIDVVELMWDLCRYEQAWFMDSPSAWCSPFKLTDHKVLEYLHDLKSQYQTGYTSDFNSDTPCNALQDMLKHFERASNPHVLASFSHSEIIRLFLVAIRAFKDDVLMTSLNYNLLQNRKWRTSVITPYGANLVAVKYDCSRDRRDSSPKVKFFLNQHALKLSWCNGDLCKINDIINQYNAFCKHAYNSASYKYSYLSVFLIIFVSLLARI